MSTFFLEQFSQQRLYSYSTLFSKLELKNIKLWFMKKVPLWISYYQRSVRACRRENSRPFYSFSPTCSQLLAWSDETCRDKHLNIPCNFKKSPYVEQVGAHLWRQDNNWKNTKYQFFVNRRGYTRCFFHWHTPKS